MALVWDPQQAWEDEQKKKQQGAVIFDNPINAPLSSTTPSSGGIAWDPQKAWEENNKPVEFDTTPAKSDNFDPQKFYDEQIQQNEDAYSYNPTTPAKTKNPMSQAFEQIGESLKKKAIPTGIFDEQSLGIGKVQGWCGVYASRISTAEHVGDSWAEKRTHIKKREGIKAGDKILLPLGVKWVDGKPVGYGHVMVAATDEDQNGNYVVTQSNADGRQNRGEGEGVATLAVYNTNDLNKRYGNEWGAVPGKLKVNAYKNKDLFSSAPEAKTITAENITPPKSITNDPEALAQFITDNNITNLKGTSWWDNAPAKKDAWNIINQNNSDVVQSNPVVPQNKLKSSGNHTIGSFADKFGSVMSKYESGGSYDRVSSGVNDPGGVSYGKYQLASKAGSLDSFLDASGYRDDFKGLSTNSAGFKRKWQELGKNDPDFQKAQDAYAHTRYYQPLADKLKSNGIDLTDRGPGVQETLLSMAIQHGRAFNVINDILEEKDIKKMSDSDVINTLFDARAVYVNSLNLPQSTKSSILRNRYPSERKDILAMGDEAYTHDGKGVMSPQNALKSSGNSELGSFAAKFGLKTSSDDQVMQSSDVVQNNKMGSMSTALGGDFLAGLKLAKSKKATPEPQDWKNSDLDPTYLANFVLDNEIGNLKSHDWWNSQPDIVKQQAWGIINEKSGRASYFKDNTQLIADNKPHYLDNITSAASDVFDPNSYLHFNSTDNEIAARSNVKDNFLRLGGALVKPASDTVTNVGKSTVQGLQDFGQLGENIGDLIMGKKVKASDFLKNAAGGVTNIGNAAMTAGTIVPATVISAFPKGPAAYLRGQEQNEIEQIFNLPNIGVEAATKGVGALVGADVDSQWFNEQVVTPLQVVTNIALLKYGENIAEKASKGVKEAIKFKDFISTKEVKVSQQEVLKALEEITTKQDVGAKPEIVKALKKGIDESVNAAAQKSFLKKSYSEGMTIREARSFSQWFRNFFDGTKAKDVPKPIAALLEDVNKLSPIEFAKEARGVFEKGESATLRDTVGGVQNHDLSLYDNQPGTNSPLIDAVGEKRGRLTDLQQEGKKDVVQVKQGDQNALTISTYTYSDGKVGAGFTLAIDGQDIHAPLQGAFESPREAVKSVVPLIEKAVENGSDTASEIVRSTLHDLKTDNFKSIPNSSIEPQKVTYPDIPKMSREEISQEMESIVDEYVKKNLDNKTQLKEKTPIDKELEPLAEIAHQHNNVDTFVQEILDKKDNLGDDTLSLAVRGIAKNYSSATKLSRTLHDVKVGELIRIGAPLDNPYHWFGEKNYSEYGNGQLTSKLVKVEKISPKSITVKMDDGTLYKVDKNAQASIDLTNKQLVKTKEDLVKFYKNVHSNKVNPDWYRKAFKEAQEIGKNKVTVAKVRQIAIEHLQNGVKDSSIGELPPNPRYNSLAEAFPKSRKKIVMDAMAKDPEFKKMMEQGQSTSQSTLSTTESRRIGKDQPLMSEGIIKKSEAFVKDGEQGKALEYKKSNTTLNVAKGQEFVAKRLNDAKRIMRGLEEPPEDVTKDAILMALRDKALKDGNDILATEARLALAKYKTRAGQNLAMLKGDVNSADVFINRVIAMRTANLAKSSLSWHMNEAQDILDNEKINVRDELYTKTIRMKRTDSIKKAQSIIDMLTCKV